MNFAIVSFCIAGATLSASPGSIPESSYEDDFAAFTDGAQIEVVGEASSSLSVSYKPQMPAQGRGGHPESMSSGPVVIRDSSGSFCVSDLQAGLCIPDPGEAVPDDGEPPAEPTVVDVVGAAAAQIERDIARLGVQPARVHVQPPGGEVLVNIDTIFYTEPQVQYLSTTVLGRAVTIEVTPVWFEWNYGDGTPVYATADPGAEYPNHTVSHVYQSAGEHYVSLRTTWNARFRVEGVSNWIPVTGQPVTTDEAGPLTSMEKTNRLVLTN